MVVRDDILVPAVLPAEAAGDDAELYKAEPPVQRERGRVGADDRVELQHTEAEVLGGFHAVPHERLPDMLPAQPAFYGIARVADVAASAPLLGCRI